MNADPGMLRARPQEERDSFSEFVHDFYHLSRSLRGRGRDAWRPPTDVYETDEDVVIKLCLPGVRTSEVLIEFHGEMVTICGVRRAPDPRGVRAYHRMEIRNGYFERKLMVRTPFDAEGTRWQYEDGFLYVYLPRRAERAMYTLAVTIRL